jgi:tetraacyldisaccharide 4'-kinase
MRKLLLPFSWLYGVATTCRNKAFDRGFLTSENARVPVVSVGNITVGGTGKTPFVEMLVRECQQRGARVAVVSRGYGRSTSGVVVVSDGKSIRASAREGGDEPVQIARHNPQAIVVVGEKRVEAARKAVDLGAEVILLDDGFQHRYLERDLNIVVLDSRRNLYQSTMLPTGDRRESLAGLSRADLLAFSRAESRENDWTFEISESFKKPAVYFRYVVTRIVHVNCDVEMTVDALKGKPLYLFSGIGDHRGFVEQMKNLGFVVVGERKFGDHHDFTGTDVRSLLDAAKQVGAAGLLTTEKDSARLSGNEVIFSEMKARTAFYAAGIVVDITEGADLLAGMLDKVLTERSV